jgi:hypothetical protein
MLNKIAKATVYVETEGDLVMKDWFSWQSTKDKNLFVNYAMYIENKRMHKAFGRIKTVIKNLLEVETSDMSDDNLAQVGYRLRRHVIKSEWSAFRKTYAKDFKRLGIEKKIKKVNASYLVASSLYDAFGL